MDKESLLSKANKVINEEAYLHANFLNSNEKILLLFAYYYYFDADSTKFDEMSDSFSRTSNEYSEPCFIYPSIIDTDTIDFNYIIDLDNLPTDLNSLLLSFALTTFDIVNKNHGNNNERAIEIFDSLNENVQQSKRDSVNYSSLYSRCSINILVTGDLGTEQNFEIQRIASEFKTKADNISFSFLFASDIQTEIDETESPKESVENGTLEIYKNTGILKFGDQESFITLISAQSLKEAYIKYIRRGLLASNLRLYVQNKKIDEKIINSIENEGENFCYYNNGIIITCENYSIQNNVIYFKDFSIVNGGQTTNLIGRTLFNNDFGIVCKVIKNKYGLNDEKVDFLAKIAEASNTQKPINAKDLIANKPEQRLLKSQFLKVGIFLKVKRGEKIDLSTFKEKWQNASNDEIAQMIYSSVYQRPGSAKNSKSKLLYDDNSYNLIFKSKYNDHFFVSLQRFKVTYDSYKNRMKRIGSLRETKIALLPHANFYTLGVISLIYKMLTNDLLRNFLFNLNKFDFESKNVELKSNLAFNDIGQLSFFLPENDSFINGKFFDRLYDLIFDNILVPAYLSFKTKYPSRAYSNFVKSDSYYYAFVISQTVKQLKDDVNEYYKELFEKYLQISDLGVDKEELNNAWKASEEKTSYAKTLQDELYSYRTKTYKDLGIEAYKIFTNSQMGLILRFLPKNKIDLKKYCKLKTDQIEEFGDDIINIVKKYTDVSNLL